jgi:hypothetical protein
MIYPNHQDEWYIYHRDLSYTIDFSTGCEDMQSLTIISQYYGSVLGPKFLFFIFHFSKCQL